MLYFFRMFNPTLILSRFRKWLPSVDGFSLWTPGILCFSIGLGIFLRLQNLSLLEDRYFLGTDDYRLVRQSRQIVEQGTLPPRDEMRAVPIGRDNAYQFTFYPYILAYAFRALKPLFPSLTLEQAAIFYPVITFGLISFVFFLLVRQLTNTTTALFASLGLATVPNFIPRTMAGYAGRDALTLLLFLLAIFLYCQSWQVETFFKQGLFVFLSGVITGILGLTWPGVGLLTTILVVLNLVYLLTDCFSQRQYFLYCLWYFPAVLLMLRYAKFYRILSEPFVFLAIGVPGLLMIAATLYWVVNRSPIWRHVPYASRLPLGVCLIGLLLPIGVATISLALGPEWLFAKVVLLKDYFSSPLGKNPIMNSIAEMQAPYFIHWWSWFGLFFFLTLAGGILLSYKTLQGFAFDVWYALCGFIVLISGTVFSRFFPHTVLNGESTLSRVLYLGSTLFFVIVIGWLYLSGCDQSHGKQKIVPKIDDRALLLLIWFILGLILTRAAQRFDLFFIPVALIAGSFLIAEICRFILPSRYHRLSVLGLATAILSFQLYICGQDLLTMFLKICTFFQLQWISPTHFTIGLNLLIGLITIGLSLSWVFVHDLRQKWLRLGEWVGVVVLTLIIFVGILGYRGLAQAGLARAKEIAPQVTPEWKEAFEWMQTNTPSDAVIAAWWDYGSWINYLGKRATIIDEEQNLYWVELMARHVLLGQSESEALTFLKTHHATHLLLSQREIDNLWLISGIGSNEKGDRRCSINTMMAHPNPSARDNINFHHPIGIPVDDELQLNGQHCPRRSLFLTDVSVPIIREKELAFGKPEATGVYRNQRLKLTIAEVYFNDKSWRFPNADLPGCLLLKPSKSNDATKFISATYLPQTARRSLLVKLFLLDESSDSFQLVYPTGRDDKGALGISRERIAVGSLNSIPKDSGGVIPAFSPRYSLASVRSPHIYVWGVTGSHEPGEKVAIISFNRYSSL